MAKRTGSAVEPSLVGQDPKRRAEIEAALYNDFKPKDVLEEIWLSDIAVLTTTIEYYRTLEAAVTLHIARHHKREAYLRMEFPDRTDFKQEEVVKSQALRKALGEFSKFDVERISAIADLILKMRRERERVYLLFERKRRPALLDAVKVAETTNREKFAVEKLND